MSSVVRDIEVLIVEDDMLLNKVMTVQLKLGGIKVRNAFNGEQALSLIAQAVPSLLLLDVTVPALDGFGVIAALRSSDKTSSIPLIIHTALDLTEQEKLTLVLGPTKFITKSTAYSDKIIGLIDELVTPIAKAST